MLRLRLQIPRWIGRKLLLAMPAAEIESLAGMLKLARGGRRLDIHATHRIDGAPLRLRPGRGCRRIAATTRLVRVAVCGMGWGQFVVHDEAPGGFRRNDPARSL
jgi:hypothetical protein